MPVTNSENTQWIEETEEDTQKSSKAGMKVLSSLSSDIDRQVKSMMKKSKNRVKNKKGKVGHQRAEICKVCGKEGGSSSIKYHIERSHLEGLVVPCDQCEKSYTTRIDLRRHKQIHS